MWAVSAALLLAGCIGALAGFKWGQFAIWGGMGGLIGQLWEERFHVPSKVKKLYAQYKGINDPVTVTWNAEYVEGSTADGSGKRRWRDYVRLKEDKNIFLLYITDQLWHSYPKRWFDEQQLEEFGRYARLANEREHPR